MITLRLDPKLERSIQVTAKQLGVSKSELIRKSIAAYIEKVNKPSPCELGRGVFGKYSSGNGSLAKDRKAIIKEKIRVRR